MAGLSSVLTGLLIAVMIVFNGELSAAVGNYRATVLIHVVGLACVLLWMLLGRKKFDFRARMPFSLYLGGPIGVMIVVANNLTVGPLGVTATLALGLLGQTITSLLIDALGLMGMPKRPVGARSAISVALILAGVAVMLMF